MERAEAVVEGAVMTSGIGKSAPVVVGGRCEWRKWALQVVSRARRQADRLAGVLRQALQDFRPLEVRALRGWLEDLGRQSGRNRDRPLLSPLGVFQPF